MGNFGFLHVIYAGIIVFASSHRMTRISWIKPQVSTWQSKA